MTIRYLDLVGGNDSNAGTSFALRKLTMASMNTTVAAGDTVRIMGCPAPTIVDGTGSVWTQNSKTVTLSGAVTKLIHDGGGATWTQSANVTCTQSATTFKSGTNCQSIAITVSSATTLKAYIATGTLNLSSYQQVTFWVQNTVAIPASTWYLALCSDTAGVTMVDQIYIPAISSTSAWTPVTVNFGGALGSSIQSVALYGPTATAMTILLNNINACLIPSNAQSLTLTSLIGKVWNLPWIGSTTYAQNIKVRPTQPNRNGFQYMVQNIGGGTTSGSEPNWPVEIGTTVVDGTVTWVCQELEDSWFPIQSINGVTVLIDNGVATLGNAGRGYAGKTETVVTYKLEPISIPLGTNFHSGTTSGTQGALLTYSGGWDATAMSTQTLEFWVSGQNGISSGVAGSDNFLAFNNIGFSRFSNGITLFSKYGYVFTNIHIKGCTGSSFANASSQPVFSITGIHASNSSSFVNLSTVSGSITRATLDSNIGDGVAIANTTKSFLMNNITARNNSIAAIGVTTSDLTLSNLIASSNTTEDISIGSAASLTLYNSTYSTLNTFTTFSGTTLYSQKNGGVVNAHLITTDGGTIASSVAQLQGTSTLSWLFSPTSTNRNISYPL